MASLAFIVFLIVLAIAAPLAIDLLGLPGPSAQNLNLTDSFGSPLGPSVVMRHTPVGKQPSAVRKSR